MASRRIWFEGRIIGQHEINDLVRQIQDAEPGSTLAIGDTLVVREAGHTTVYTERFVEWDKDPEVEDDDIPF